MKSKKVTPGITGNTHNPCKNHFIHFYGRNPSETTIYVTGKDNNKLFKCLKKQGFKILYMYQSIAPKWKARSPIILLNKKRKMLCNFGLSTIEVYHHFENKFSFKLAKLLHKCPDAPKVTKQNISLLCHNKDEFCLKNVTFDKNKGIKHHYAKDLYPVHKQIVKKLSKNKSGLCLLHGKPGTGKTSYIRYLTSVVDRTFILIPPNMVGHVSSPSFVSFMLGYPKAVLIIEDAENAVASRDKGNKDCGGVAELLNLSDGLLGSALKCAVITTFNTDIRNIDTALLRKGRLICEHEFKKLSKDEANRLFKKLKKPEVAEGDMSLTDIFNYDEKLIVNKEEKRTIGFTRPLNAN